MAEAQALCDLNKKETSLLATPQPLAETSQKMEQTKLVIVMNK